MNALTSGQFVCFVLALSLVAATGRLRASHAAGQAVRAAGRPGRQGRRLGADTAGARREDARHGEGDAAGLRDGPRLGRRPDGDHRRQARRHRRGHRIQPGHGGAVEEERGGGRRQTAKATFTKADLFETDLSKATVITMFLLPSINMKLRPKILDLKPGTRIVTNSFTMEDWQPDQSETVTDDCTSWCTAHLWIVPAKVDGTWQVRQRHAVAETDISELHGDDGQHDAHRRQAEWRSDRVLGRRHEVHGSR